MGLKKKDLERMFQQALAAYQQPSKYETAMDNELARMDGIIANKDFSNLPTEYAPDFHDVAVEQDKRSKLANLHQTGIGAWNSGDGKALESVKQANASLYANDIRQGNENAVRNFIDNRNNLRSGLLGQAMQRNQGALNVITPLYQNAANKPSFWGDAGRMAIGTGLKVASKFI